MVEKLIARYVSKLQKQDVINFALKNSISLTENEIDLIYLNIKSNWHELIFGDYKTILEKYKDQINQNTYQKIEEFIILYKDKYQNYL